MFSYFLFCLLYLATSTGRCNTCIKSFCRGSFYWHFKDRADFVRQLVEYWSLNFTQNVPDEPGQMVGNAQERLLGLMTHIVRDNLARYDIAIRAWASHDPTAARAV